VPWFNLPYVRIYKIILLRNDYFSLLVEQTEIVSLQSIDVNQLKLIIIYSFSANAASNLF
jgi:hypothetical protein